MPRRARPAILLLALAALLGLAACGGGDDEGDDAAGSTTVEATVATTEETADARLSAASWATYVEARDKARTINNAAIKTFGVCRAQLGSAESEQVHECLDKSTDAVVTEGKELLATLTGFQSEVGGACATANTNLAGSVKLYVASVNAIGVAVDTGAVTSTQAAIDNALEGLGAARKAVPPFERDCKPL